MEDKQQPQQPKVEAPLYPNCRVSWTYKHWLNSTTYTHITKEGRIVRQIRERGGLQRPTGYYKVLFDGNKTPTKVHETKLKNLSVGKLLDHE